MTQETIIPESTGEKLTKMLKKEIKGRKFFIAFALLAIVLIAGYAVGYQSGYHDALIQFKIIEPMIYKV